jgi:Rod binding domain-containing protein
MDNNELILTGDVSPPMLLEFLGGASSGKPLQDIDKNAAGELSQAKKKQVARDFESVFISKLLDEMKNTIGDWGFERDGASQQIHGIFWLYLARDVANKGGFGLWEDVYRLLTSSDGTGGIESSG